MDKPVAVVVGVGPGLGSALARRFAKAGMAVAVARSAPSIFLTRNSMAPSSINMASSG